MHIKCGAHDENDCRSCGIDKVKSRHRNKCYSTLSLRGLTDLLTATCYLQVQQFAHIDVLKLMISMHPVGDASYLRAPDRAAHQMHCICQGWGIARTVHKTMVTWLSNWQGYNAMRQVFD